MHDGETTTITVMLDKCTTMVANQIISLGSTTVDSSNGVSKMNKTSYKMEHLVKENGNNGSVVNTYNECGKSFKEITLLNGQKAIH